MNRKMIFAGIVAAAWLLAGCESDRAKTPGVMPEGARGALHPEKPLTQAEIIARAAAQPVSTLPGEGWQPLFSSNTLSGWKLSGFAGAGEVECTQGLVVFGMGEMLTGISCTNPVPTMDYEIALEAMRVTGTDFFCGLTFPVRDTHCSLIVGGWGGSLVGISSLDDQDASENETTQFIGFENGRWYRIRLRVSETKIEAWIEQKKIVDVVTTGRKLSLRGGEISRSKPLGLATWVTSAAFRDMKIRRVNGLAETSP